MPSQRKSAENEISELMGFVPDFYNVLPDSVFNETWQLQKNLELGHTVLDTKTKELIGVAVASQLKCKYCVYFHTRAATAFGATEEELLEAAAMGGMTALLSNVITGGQVEFEEFKQNVNRALRHITAIIGREGGPGKTTRRYQ